VSSHVFSYASLANVQLLEELHAQYLEDPKSVDPSWRTFFEGMEFGEFREHKAVLAEASRDIRVYQLIDAYRTFGHLLARVNPVATADPAPVHELSLKTLGFEQSELEALFPSVGLLKEEEAPLREIISVLELIYCRTIGVEYMDFQSPELERWLQEQIEPTHFRPSLSVEKKQQILQGLNRSELFETFLHTKFVGQKRFSLEGGETLIPILHEIIESGAEIGMDEFVIGMPHRGRLNVLTNTLGKSFSMLFSEFEDFYDPTLFTEGTGDVKYHKGFSANIETSQGKLVHIRLSANPSHLESVDPIVEGSVRAKQVLRKDEERTRVVPILIHGDASLSGQGVVYECMQLYGLPGYTTGGTIHIVVNNQIGFTTLPEDGRSTRYCTDIARTFSAPIFHVNAEDPEGCIYATQLAIQIRQKFHCDVFIDMYCYRKYGHNERDEPAFTQPLEYQLIRQKRTIRQIYRDELIQHGYVEKEMAKQLEEEFKGALHHELEEMKLKKEPPSPPEAFGGVWQEFKKGAKKDLFLPVKTPVEGAILREIASRFCAIPEGFNIHPKVARLAQERLKMVDKGGKIDWGMGEHLAFASLLWEGTHVRLAGQDTRRGTFSQRHAMWTDQKNDDRHFPLLHLTCSPARRERSRFFLLGCHSSWLSF